MPFEAKAHWWWFQANLTINVRISGISQFKQIFLLIGSLFFSFNFSQIMPIISISFHIFLKDIQVQIAIYVPIYLHIWISMLNMRV